MRDKVISELTDVILSGIFLDDDMRKTVLESIIDDVKVKMEGIDAYVSNVQDAVSNVLSEMICKK